MYPLSYLEEMVRRNRDKRPSLSSTFPVKQISVTDLLRPAHQLRLMVRHEEAITVDPMEQAAALLGNAWHEYVAKHQTHGVSERNTGAMWREWMITGTPDWFSIEEGVLHDYKTAKVWAHVYGRREWEEQVNLYRWILHRNGFEMKVLQIHALWTDWTQRKAMEEGMPKEPITIYDIRPWPIEDIEAFIADRITALEAWDGLCTPEERWERGEHWALMKQGRKRALKRYNTLSEAEEAMGKTPSTYIEHRPGTPARCQGYCPVAEWCSFGRAVQQGSQVQ